MTQSRWDTGTYDLLISKDPDAGPGDLMVVVFARPTDENDRTADQEAPILAHIDVQRTEYDRDLEDYHFGMRSFGQNGLLRPEDVEKVFGPLLGVRILLALYQAADRDFRGVDMDAHPWRPPSEEGAFPIMQRTHTLLMDLRRRLFGQP